MIEFLLLRRQQKSWVAVVFLATLAGVPASAAAGTASDTTFSSFRRVRVDAPTLRTMEDVARNANMRPMNPVAPGAIINRPTIPLETYRRLKLATTASSGSRSPQAANTPVSASNASVQANFDGAFEDEILSDDFFPSDSIIAAGPNQIVEVTNSFIDVWDKTNPGQYLLRVTQNSFVNSPDELGDGRVLYDWSANRWIVLLADFSHLTGSTKPVLFLAVSQTSDASMLPPSGWFIYPIKIRNGSPRFVDFPQLGQDANALIVTTNLFTRSGFYVGPSVLTIPKRAIYAHKSFTFGMAIGKAAIGTVTPPNVIASNANAADYLLAPPVGSNSSIMMFTLLKAGTRSASISRSPRLIPVDPYNTPPPLAEQTCDDAFMHEALDTIDGRFQNDSLQNGNLLWNAHTITDGSRPVVRWYEIEADTQSVVQSNDIHLSQTSYDFNPSIASASDDAAVLNWTATDPDNGTDAMVVIAGRQSGDALGAMTLNPTPVVTSSACMTHDFDPNFGFQRWGDYSAVSLDYSGGNPNGTYWLVNQYTGNNFWQTRIASVANP